MKPIFHPQPVNGPFDDPVIYVDFMFEKRALLFDLGDIATLPPKKILRISHIFVSHAHMDHFIGFDYLLRICLGRNRELYLFGPRGFIDRVEHKLAGYTWNLVHSYDTDFTLLVCEIDEEQMVTQARFRCRNAFRRETGHRRRIHQHVILDEESFRVRATVLDHQTPCLAYTLEEKLHINVWKNRLVDLGLPTGPWLKQLKSAVRRGENDDFTVTVSWQDGRGEHRHDRSLGELRDRLLSIVPGQKLAYVVDCAYHDVNRGRILALIEDSDILYIETVFLQKDADRARETAHLTAVQAGQLAKQARVKRLVAIHFSPRYSDRPEALEREAMIEFLGNPAA